MTLWLLIGIALGTLASEDLALIGAGILVSQGHLSLGEAVLAGFVGILGGDLLLYAAGRFLAGSLLRRAPMRWIIAPRDLERARLVHPSQRARRHPGQPLRAWPEAAHLRGGRSSARALREGLRAADLGRRDLGSAGGRDQHAGGPSVAAAPPAL